MASGINASGQIVGIYGGADGFVHAFFATQSPADSAVAGPGPSAGVRSGAVVGDGVATVSGGVIAADSAGSKDDGMAIGTLTVKDSSVLGNVAPSGPDIYNLAALSLDDSIVGVLGP